MGDIECKLGLKLHLAQYLTARRLYPRRELLHQWARVERLDLECTLGQRCFHDPACLELRPEPKLIDAQHHSRHIEGLLPEIEGCTGLELDAGARRRLAGLEVEGQTQVYGFSWDDLAAAEREVMQGIVGTAHLIAPVDLARSNLDATDRQRADRGGGG